MKTNVADTSIAAYHGLTHRESQKDRIYAYIEQHGSATIRMVAKALHMEISTVSARINEMRKGDTPLLEYAETKKDPITGVTAKYWQLAEVKEQLEFGWDEVR